MQKKYNNIWTYIQIILLITIIITGIMSIFIDQFAIVMQALVAMMLVVLSYNNYKIYNRKYFTLIYLIVGIFVAVATILKAIYGI